MSRKTKKERAQRREAERRKAAESEAASAGTDSSVVMLEQSSLLPLREELALELKAIRGDYPITNSERKRIINKAMSHVDTNPDVENQLAAMRVVLAADKINAMRESHQEEVRHNEVMESTLAMREALKSPEARQLFLNASESFCEPIPAVAEQPTNGQLNGQHKP
jgi:hypothetical protein